MVKLAQKFLADPAFLTMIECLRNEHPLGELYVGIPIEERGVIQARCEGYALCLNNLEALGKFEPATQPLESEFSIPEEEIVNHADYTTTARRS